MSAQNLYFFNDVRFCLSPTQYGAEADEGRGQHTKRQERERIFKTIVFVSNSDSVMLDSLVIKVDDAMSARDKSNLYDTTNFFAVLFVSVFNIIICICILFCNCIFDRYKFLNVGFPCQYS